MAPGPLKYYKLRVVRRTYGTLNHSYTFSAHTYTFWTISLARRRAAPHRSGPSADSGFQVSVTRCLFSLFPVPAYLRPEALHDASTHCAVLFPYLPFVAGRVS